MKLINKLISVCVALIFVPIVSQAAELNLAGFTGSINSTLTSGFTMRTQDNDCKGLPGYTAEMSLDTVSPTAMTFMAGKLNPIQSSMSDAKTAALLNFTSKNGAGCATSETDGYGNTSYNPLRFGNQNADDGKMNFPNSGDVIDATQKMFTEISGYADNGTGINLSFIGSVNPALDINEEDFVRMTSKAKSQFESDLTLLDAYFTQSFDMGGGYVDLSIGRLATSFGEATFLPIGMNGLVTSGLDLTKLRAPGASIRDAIIPTEQIVAAFQAGDWGVEAYYQFGHDPVQLDPKGAFYGSDLAGTGAKNLLASGGWYEGDLGGDMACSYSYNVIELANSANGLDAAAAASACNAASLTKHTGDDKGLYSTTNLARLAQVGASAVDWISYSSTGRGATYGSALQAVAGESAPGFFSQGLLTKYTSNPSSTALTLATNVYTDANLVETDYNTGATVALALADTKYKKVSSGAQDYGFSAHTYLDDLGTGVDIGIYYANYTSKVPYAQIIGKGGVLAGDHVGMYKFNFADYAGKDLVGTQTAGHRCGADIVGKTRVTSELVSNSTTFGLGNNEGANCAAWLALANGAYGSGVAGGFTAISGSFDAFRKDGGNNTVAANSQTNFIAKNYISQALFGAVIEQANGRSKIFHNPQAAVSGAAALYKTAGSGFDAGTDLAFLSYGATLLPAITPLNLAQVQFIYPEDNQLIGASFNTNVNGTTVQGEVSYRPDFKLGTGVGDQVNQISDASGSS